MPICQKCKNHFSNWTQVRGQKRNLCNRKFCLTCSPFGKHNTQDITVIKTYKTGYPYYESKYNGCKCKCSICQRTYIYNRKSGHTLIKCNSCGVNKRKLDLKIKLIQLKGGKCKKCGYNNHAALVFHHFRDKKFALSAHCRTRAWKKICKEVKKCTLLCSNCHLELHANKRNAKKGLVV